MEVYYHKEIQAFEYVTFSELKIQDKGDFCCDKLKKYVSEVKAWQFWSSQPSEAWNGKIGTFCIVEKDHLVPIDYCPFCGEKIEYISVE